MGINIWEVIDAAKTKPFGFMPFYPGPGLGGHCIPIDPFYLTWKAREHNIATRFIELAGQINNTMPELVIDALARALDTKSGRGLNGARVLVLGLAYKKNVDDTRESPALRLIELLQLRGAKPDYYDPFAREIPRTREHPELAGWKSIDWDIQRIAEYDVVLIATDHDGVDYCRLAEAARLVIDTRNACARAGADLANVVAA
jgi:UDP-N-acetyl-D-glucosamine dehydrogenase